jgi:DNA-binding NtrC family response regulator
MNEKILVVEDEFIVANDLQNMLKKAGYSVSGIAATVNEARTLIEKTRPNWVLLDIFLQNGSMGTELAEELTQKGIGFIYVSANTNQSILEEAKATQPYGFLVKPFRERDLLIMLEIAMEKHQQNLHLTQQRELMLQRQLELIANPLIDQENKTNQIPGIFQGSLPFDLLRICMIRNKSESVEDLTFIRAGFDEYQALSNGSFIDNLGLSKLQINEFKAEIFEQTNNRFYTGTAYRQLLLENTYEKVIHNRYRTESKLSFQLQISNDERAVLMFYSRKADTYITAHLNLLNKAVKPLSLLLETLMKKGSVSNGEKNANGNRTKRNLSTIPGTAGGFLGIIGNSEVLVSVLDKISLVAPAPSSVLILGDSGTGKERVAQCIHHLSPRKSKDIITVNCAALPKELIESELFGHEKGAFTGAIDKRTGKFELADGGTIFLDEVGELPLEAQVKLLRVLQEREVEHVGGNKRIKVDVRIIAATNRNLEREVAEGRFRLDLYYRLNVFPIELPPLRQRKEDIPLLAAHFINKFCDEMGKPQTTLSHAAMNQLMQYDWPGNIRELEHLIERTVLVTPGQLINQIILPASNTAAQTFSNYGDNSKLKTLEEMETDHILSVLRSCKGKVCGDGGAAEILGLPASTLNSKIKKLGIRKEAYFNR